MQTQADPYASMARQIRAGETQADPQAPVPAAAGRSQAPWMQLSQEEDRPAGVGEWFHDLPPVIYLLIRADLDTLQESDHQLKYATAVEVCNRC